MGREGRRLKQKDNENQYKTVTLGSWQVLVCFLKTVWHTDSLGGKSSKRAERQLAIACYFTLSGQGRVPRHFILVSCSCSVPGMLCCGAHFYITYMYTWWRKSDLVYKKLSA